MQLDQSNVTESTETDSVTSDTTTSDVPLNDVVTADETSKESVQGDDGYAFVEFLEFDFKEDLQEFYNHYLLETPDGLIQIFQSMTYGEMMISFLLFVLIVLYVMRWVYDVLFVR